MVWTYEKYLTFIEDYRKCTILWDVKNPNYTNNNKKRKIIIDLARKYGLDEASLKKKIKNLRSAFHREHHRLNKLKDEQQDVDGIRKWFGYEALKFILDVTGPKKDGQTYSTEDHFHDEPEDDQDHFDISTQYIQVPELHEPQEPNSPETSQSNVNVSKEEDEFDLFGRSMTVQLRKMPELVALDLMQKMQLMVFNAKKQLNKAKNKTKKKIAKQASIQEKISKKSMRSPSPMSHTSSPSPIYKLEAISPEVDTRMWDKDGDFYEYTQDEHSTKVTSEDHKSGTALKRQLKRKTFNLIDPLDVKISRSSSQCELNN